MHELVDQIHAGGDAHEQPADIRREDKAENGGGRDRHQGEHHQRIGRKYGDAPILVVAEAHFLVAEELMMIERVPLVDRAQAFDVHRPVHDVFVHRPLEDVGEDEGQRHREPFQPGHVMDVRDVDVKHRRAHGVDQRDVEIAVVPADDAGAVFVAEVDLPLGDHCRFSLGLPLPSPPFLVGCKIIISRRRGEPSSAALDAADARRRSRRR